ncbi:MAG: thaumatin family protein, partial [Candidatus Magnetominusculus sp. LBB02]|nr:thaumatin family protein [Candidatus Magnetominusculus sp. LBB02]
MRKYVLFCLITLAAVSIVFQAGPCSSATQSHSVLFINSCSYPVWVGQFGQTATSPSDGWKLDIGSYSLKTLPNRWSGRLWPRTGCTFDNSTGLCPNPYADCCITGGCVDNDSKFALKCNQGGNPPTSLFELTLDIPYDTVYGPYDTVDISYVDGFGVPVMVTPVYPFDYPKVGNPGLNDAAHWCKAMGHPDNPVCPDKMTLSDNVSCYSPCQYAVRGLGLSPSTDLVANICCSNSNVQVNGYNCIDNVTIATDSCCLQDQWKGGFGCSPYVLDNITSKQKYDDNEVCKAMDDTSLRSFWGNITTPKDPLLGKKAIEYVKNVHDTYPGVYAWQFDDFSSTYTCRLTGGVLNYVVAFCPNDYTAAEVAIYGIYLYGSNSATFGTPYGGITTNGAGDYTLTFTNGMRLLAASNGYMHFYDNGKWVLYTDTVSPNGVQWKNSG